MTVSEATILLQMSLAEWVPEGMAPMQAVVTSDGKVSIRPAEATHIAARQDLHYNKNTLRPTRS